ncbi:MAG: LpqB family beta-propeller domain-containing protein, partial [Patescibacteria group bacterium]|nr:LpqB family beta-propeller domain-containing protein [Patescibacteria group bacterium]
GIDCGGSCANLCEEDARMPNILWARAFETAPQTYTAVAYIENRNQGAGARQVPYSFQLYDDKNELVVEREGVVDLPPITAVPVILPNIDIGNRSVARTLFKFTAEPTWERVRVEALPQVRITQQQLTGDGTRLSAVIVNDGFTDIRNLQVAGVVFDSQGIVRAASLTTIPQISAKASQPAVFTWSKEVANVARAEITVLPSF